MAITSLNSVNQLIFVMVKCCVLFEVRTEFLNIIWTSLNSSKLPPVVDAGDLIVFQIKTHQNYPLLWMPAI
jgi:hypothetical protein